MSLTDLYTETFIPQTLSPTTDNTGGFSEGWVDGASFPGRLSILGITERMSDDKVTMFESHKIYCAPSVTLTNSGRVKLGARIFEIKGIQLPSNLATGIGHQEVTVLEIDG